MYFFFTIMDLCSTISGPYNFYICKFFERFLCGFHVYHKFLCVDGLLFNCLISQEEYKKNIRLY